MNLINSYFVPPFCMINIDTKTVIGQKCIFNLVVSVFLLIIKHIAFMFYVRNYLIDFMSFKILIVYTDILNYFYVIQLEFNSNFMHVVFIFDDDIKYILTFVSCLLVGFFFFGRGVLLIHFFYQTNINCK